MSYNYYNTFFIIHSLGYWYTYAPSYVFTTLVHVGTNFETLLLKQTTFC